MLRILKGIVLSEISKIKIQFLFIDALFNRKNEVLKWALST